MKICLKRFLNVTGDWIYLSNLETDTMYVVVPNKFVKMEDFSVKEQEFVADALKTELIKRKYDYDMSGMMSFFNGLTAIPLMEYDNLIGFDAPEEEEEATWH